MKEEIQENVKDIITEPIKAIPKKVITDIWDKKQFEQMFLEAGQWIAEYERDGTEETELRSIIFGEENMREIANYMHQQDSFRWFQILQQGIHVELQKSGMSAQNQKNCEKHFLEIIRTRMQERQPIIVERSMQHEIAEGVDMLGEQNSQMLQKIIGIEKILQDQAIQKEETRQHKRQEKKKDPSSHERKWNLSHTHVEGVFLPKEEREGEICKLTEIWEQERKNYPGWYILPYSICQELNIYSRENGLLQSAAYVETQKMFAFAYELVWRYETCMHNYSSYEIHHIYKIWQEYATQNECVQKWFYVGQALLRVFREEGNYTEWTKVYDQLKAYEAYGVNGKIDLRLEKLKYEYHRLNIPAMRRALDKCHPKKENYEQRLQILGIRVELDETEEVITELEQLMQDLQKIDAADEKDQLYYKSLEASVLQLYSLCVQDAWDYMGEYEGHQGEIDRIEEEIAKKKKLFDWDRWRDNVQKSLLQWYVRKYEKKEAFAINRELYTFISSSNECEAAYRFYRLLEKLALPLECGHITLLGNLEQPWIEAIVNQEDMLGLFLLCREAKSSTIKALVDRKYLSELANNRIGDMVGLLIHALSENIEELDEQEQPLAGGILSRIRENVPQLLIRFMSRCPDSQQENALLLLKDLMEDEKLFETFPLTELCVAVLENVSEKKKAQMLGTMMQTKIIEHKTLGGHENGIDIFAYYFQKKDIGPLCKECAVKQETIEWLLQMPKEAGYEWQTKIWRLKTLDYLGLLNEKQHEAYATMVWNFVDEKTGLPQLHNIHLFVYEELPCIDAHIPAKSVKHWFLSNNLTTQFQDEDGCKGTMGKIPYLDELILLCENG